MGYSPWGHKVSAMTEHTLHRTVWGLNEVIPENSTSLGILAPDSLLAGVAPSVWDVHTLVTSLFCKFLFVEVDAQMLPGKISVPLSWAPLGLCHSATTFRS